MVRKAATEALWISLVLAPQVSAFTPTTWVPPSSLSNPLWSPGHAPAAKPGLDGYISVECHTIPPKLTLTAVCILEASPSSHVFAHGWPDTCYWPPVPRADLWQGDTAMQMHTNSWGPQSCLWARILPSNCIGRMNGLKQKQKNNNKK